MTNQPNKPTFDEWYSKTKDLGGTREEYDKLYTEDGNELFRLASLIGCEPQSEQKHIEKLLTYIQSNYILKSDVEKMLANADPMISDEELAELRKTEDL